jgi:hypothetical protein
MAMEALRVLHENLLGRGFSSEHYTTRFFGTPISGDFCAQWKLPTAVFSSE